MRAEELARLARTRIDRPDAVARLAETRERPGRFTGPSGRCLIIAADHPARGALATGGDRLAMADRGDLLERLCTALADPGCTGVLATADILDDLLLLGVLDGKSVFASMNRGGLAGSVFEIDDRYTGMSAAAIRRMGYDGGKLLLRLDYGDARTASALEAAARAVDALAEQGLTAMVEPFVSRRGVGGVVNDLSTEAVIRSVAIASGLGSSSVRTVLKLPAVPGMDRVAAASTLPMVLLGGEVTDLADMREQWSTSLALPNVVGLTVGRSLLYPAGGDVAGAIASVVELL